MSATQRLEMRVDDEVKRLAERAASALGCNVTEYISRLIRESAPKVLETQTTITLTNQQFDEFIAACEQAKPLSPRLRKAAQRLDEEGF
jgi:uncharacterized protein (DUF1778 family)